MKMEEHSTKRRALEAARLAWRQLVPPPVRQRVRRARVEFSNLGQVKRNQAFLALHLADLEARNGSFDGVQGEVPDPRFPKGIRSRLCTQAQLSEPWFPQWIKSMGERPRANRKAWEWAYIAHALDELDMFKPGRRGLGFGVGHDPLVPLFARAGWRSWPPISTRR